MTDAGAMAGAAAAKGPIRLAVATDANMVEAALVVIGSALDHASRAVEVHFLGYDLEAAQRDRVRAYCEARGAALIYHEITPALFAGAEQQDPNISLVTLARMHLPRWVEGRITYLDCDMLVLGDLAEVQDADLAGQPLGAVRDFFVLDQLRKSPPRLAKLAHHQALFGRADVAGYFNAGLLVMDCDAIRADADLCARIGNASEASQYRYMDQDFLNLHFDGRVQYLPQAWNSIWGRDRLRARALKGLPWLPEAEKRPAAAQLIHYTGPRKPWKRQSRLNALQRGRLPALLAWRRAARRILR